MPPELTVILPAHNPHPGRLRRTLEGLAAQTLPGNRWELLVVDNASHPPWEAPAGAMSNLRRIREPRTGLTFARLCGIRAAEGELLVFADDDNVLAPEFLTDAVRIFEKNPRLGAAGGPVVPEWEEAPPAWAVDFQGLLALRDLGGAAKVCPGGPRAAWPDFAPVGAGLVVRREAALKYAAAVTGDARRETLDRSGRSLGSGGDNDLVFSVLHDGGDVGYFPELRVTHLIPAGRLRADYLARLNAGIMRTWVVVLRLHGQCPWPAVAPWTVPFRCARAWWRTRAWRSEGNRIRWAGRCGQFRGQGDIHGMRGGTR